MPADSSTSSTGQRLAALRARNPAALPAGVGGGAVTLITILALLRGGADNGEALVRVLRELGLIGAAVAVGAFLLTAIIVGWLQARDQHRDEIRSATSNDLNRVLQQLARGQDQLAEGQRRHDQRLDTLSVEVREVSRRVDEISRPVPLARSGYARPGASTSIPRMPTESDWTGEPTQTEGGKAR